MGVRTPAEDETPTNPKLSVITETYNTIQYYKTLYHNQGSNTPMQALATTHAEPCKPVQKEEWINTILIDITQNPKITNNQLAEKYSVHRNRISKYRNLIRQRQLKTDLEIINKIDNRLEDLMMDMEPRDLIAYRRAIHSEVHLNENITETKTVTYNLTYSEEDKNAILAARRAIHNRRSSPSEPISIH